MPPWAALSKALEPMGPGPQVDFSPLMQMEQMKRQAAAQQALEAYRNSQLGISQQKLGLEEQRMKRPWAPIGSTETGWWMPDPSGRVTPLLPPGQKETKVPPHPTGDPTKGGFRWDPGVQQWIPYEPTLSKQKAIEDIEAEAAARARGTASVVKPPKEPITDFGTFHSAGLEKGWNNEKISAEWHKLKVAEQAAAAQTRGESYGMNRPINVLDTARGNAPVIMTLREMRAADPTGQRFLPAGPAERALLQTVRADEMKLAANDVRIALDRLPEFSTGFMAKMALVGRAPDPRRALSLFIGGEASRTLSPAEFDYVSSVRSLIESAYAVRTILGAGQGSDLMREAIAATVPGPMTPSKDAAERQLRVFEVQIDRLSRGIPLVPLRPAPEVPPPTASRPGQGQGLPIAQPAEKKKYDAQGRAFIQRNGQVIEVRP